MRIVARFVAACAAAAALVAGVTAPSSAPVVDLLPTSDDVAPQPVVSRDEPIPRSPRPTPAERALARLSLPQQVGQLFMVGTPAASASAATLGQIRQLHVGNVMLTGRSYSGVRAPARVAAAAQARATRRATGGVPLLVSTDQEGGQVQVLNGRGFSDIPSALTQGTWSPRRLHRAATTWARQLRRAGVNMNLAPVVDTVPGPRAAAANPPIGQYDREFGYRVRRVARHGVAVVRGMADRRVAATAKHFPGLGRVHANTDTSSGVTDRVTGRHDRYLVPFRRAIEAHVPAVMMSTAYYTRLDRRHPAAFSRFVVRTMLRHDLGFRGVVVSDDLGTAQQVARWSYGARAVSFLRAGGDLVLTVDPRATPAMYAAVLHRARADRHFRGRVHRSALRVLELKQHLGLLGR